jgi:hypothetical protein
MNLIVVVLFFISITSHQTMANEKWFIDEKYNSEIKFFNEAIDLYGPSVSFSGSGFSNLRRGFFEKLADSGYVPAKFMLQNFDFTNRRFNKGAGEELYKNWLAGDVSSGCLLSFIAERSLREDKGVNFDYAIVKGAKLGHFACVYLLARVNNESISFEEFGIKDGGSLSVIRKISEQGFMPAILYMQLVDTGKFINKKYVSSSKGLPTFSITRDEILGGKIKTSFGSYGKLIGFIRTDLCYFSRLSEVRPYYHYHDRVEHYKLIAEFWPDDLERMALVASIDLNENYCRCLSK